MAYDEAVAILFVGFAALFGYLATQLETDSRDKFLLVVNNMMRLLFFVGSLLMVLMGFNFGTLILTDSCAGSVLQTTPASAYKIVLWTVIFVSFIILISIIYNIFAGFADKKKQKEIKDEIL